MKTWDREHKLVGHPVLVLGQGAGWVVGVDRKNDRRIRVLINERPVNTTHWMRLHDERG